ncbi:MAG: virulence-associated protein E [Parasporobacterium sp.]|nr:virulence-associated protein E [Parasporobacterium sp.]MBR3359805.1 virulence-associated protein E [Lachnospiraceae bacterium]
METIEQETLPEEAIKKKLELNTNGFVKQTIKNSVTVLEEDPLFKGKIRLNELSEMTDIVGDVFWDRSWMTMDDIDRAHIMMRLEEVYGLSSDKRIDRAITVVASHNRYHPIREKLLSLKWDGKPRVKHALRHFLGAEETEMSYEALKLFMLGAACRVFKPGCKFETMLCLVGKTQGTGKSTFMRFLAISDDWFTDDIKHLDDERIFQKLQGHWICELPEMLAAINARNVEDIKSFLSRQRDNYRIPYEKFAKDRPRQCVFAGTSNKKQFLPSDHSGNRRLIPIEVHEENAEVHILDDEEASRAYILQMWAEIMEIYKSGNYSLTLPKHLQKQLSDYQKEFTPEDFEETEIRNYLNDTELEYVCTMMIFHQALGHPMSEKPAKWQSISINEVLGKMPDWEQVSVHRFEHYGLQRAWKRVSTNDGFVPVSDDKEIPFGD